MQAQHQCKYQANSFQIICWDDYDSKGNNITITNNTQDLPDYRNQLDFAGISSCCFSGGLVIVYNKICFNIYFFAYLRSVIPLS